MKKRGTGISVGTHPAGMKGGGDPSQAQIRLKPDGSFDLLNGAVDIGQGCKTILRQLAAAELDVPIENITHNNFDTDIGPMCTGTFASRVTFMDGNAVLAAASDLKAKIKVWASKNFQCEADDVEVADNRVYVKGQPDKSLAMSEVGPMVNWGGEFLVGIGAYMAGPGQEFDPETGKMTSLASLAFGCCIVDLQVDTETGVVDLLKLVQVYDVGKALNRLLCKGQNNGGAMMGISFGLSEDTCPYYPSMDFAIKDLSDYILTTAADMPSIMIEDVVEIPHPNGPHGAKGYSEMTSSLPGPAIINAIHDAIGVWVTDYPATPERILQALEARS